MIAPHVEQARVASHIHRAERLAAGRDVVDLLPLQRLVRELLLEELARYRAAGQFPLNPGLGRQTPIFVDDHGTRCAMAHLLEFGGEGALVEKIRTERNTAYVRELADEPRLVAWLAAAGLSVEEAAAIQPSYCETRAQCVCSPAFGGGTKTTGVVAATIVTPRAGSVPATARVEQTWGEPAELKVGVEFEVWSNARQGQILLTLPVVTSTKSDGGITYEQRATLENGKYSCSSMGTPQGSAPPLTAAEFAAAVLAPDCKQHLTSKDLAWGVNSCPGPGGCAVALGGDPTSLGILLAIAGVLLARRLR